MSVALIDVETLDVRPVRRRYTRLGERRWAVTDLEADATQVVPTEFDVDEHGLVIDEPGRFRRSGEVSAQRVMTRSASAAA